MRLAVLLNRSRVEDAVPQLQVGASRDPVALDLRFPEGFLDQSPLTRADLEEELGRLGAVGITLSFA